MHISNTDAKLIQIITLREYKLKNTIWSNKIRIILCSRKIELLNTEYYKVQILQNLIIMDYAIQHMKENDRNYEILVPINCMRLRKIMYLLCELIGKNDESKTKEYR